MVSFNLPYSCSWADSRVTAMYMECDNKAFSVLMLLSLLRIDTTSGAEKTVLHFSYITTKTGGFVSSGSIPMVDFALEQINNRTDILPNYTLNYTNILDSNVSGDSKVLASYRSQ